MLIMAVHQTLPGLAVRLQGLSPRRDGRPPVVLTFGARRHEREHARKLPE